VKCQKVIYCRHTIKCRVFCSGKKKYLGPKRIEAHGPDAQRICEPVFLKDVSVLDFPR
jgi:hypothetical protein